MSKRGKLGVAKYKCVQALMTSFADPSTILELFYSYFASSDRPMHPDCPVSSAIKDLSMLEADSFTHEDLAL